MARLWGPNCPVLPTTYGARGPPASEVGRPQEIGDDRLGAEAGTGAGVALAICHHDDLSLGRRGLPLTQTLQT